MGNAYMKRFPPEDIKILFQGLEGVGKTTILHQLKLGEVVTTIPTEGLNVKTIDHKNIHITACDVGGRDGKNQLYKQYLQHYYPMTKAVVFVVDSSDRDESRIQQARDELHQTLTAGELKDIPLVVLANKRDIANVISVHQLKENLQLHRLGSRKWRIFPTVATKGDGFSDALDWLTGILQSKTAVPTLTALPADLHLMERRFQIR